MDKKEFVVITRMGYFLEDGFKQGKSGFTTIPVEISTNSLRRAKFLNREEARSVMANGIHRIMVYCPDINKVTPELINNWKRFYYKKHKIWPCI